MKSFKANDLVQLIVKDWRGNQKTLSCYLGTSEAYRAKYNEECTEDRPNGWINQNVAVMTSDREANLERIRKHKAAPIIEAGEIIEVDGREYRVQVNGDYSDAGTLIRI